MHRITTRIEAEGLAEMVLSKSFPFPAVIVSRPTHSEQPMFPLDRLEDEVGSSADIYFLADRLAFRRALEQRVKNGQDPDDYSVYGGAARVFPAGVWHTSPRVFTAYDAEDGSARVTHIADHIRQLSKARGSLSYSTDSRAHDALREESAALRNVHLAAENERLSRELAAANRRALASAPAPKPRAAVAHVAVAPVGRMFSNAEDEIAHRILVLWAESTTPQQKDEQPLPAYTMSEQFAASVEEIAGTNASMLDKIARAALKVLLGQARDAHRLVIPGSTRASDGAAPWRTYVEQKTAAARRLHYWLIPGGGVEFSRVVLHDDYRP